MLQSITLKQLDELSDEKIGKLFDWFVEKDYISGERLLVNDSNSGKRLTLHQRMSNGEEIFTIGRMIEFIDEMSKMPFTILKKSEWHNGGFDVIFAKKKPEMLSDIAFSNAMRLEQSEELCDALWAAVKICCNHSL